MKCVIPGRYIRAFGKAIQCLSKIGDELYLEATSDGLAMKTVNPARSAYACFTFKKMFFHVYQDGRDASSAETLKCKITVKSCMSVFRALPTLEKTVDHCTLTLNLEENKLVFVFYCKHGIVKTHNLGFQECEALQAVYSKDLCPNRIVGNSKVLSDVVSNFPPNLEEVTLIAEPDKARLRSYTEDDSGENVRVAVSEINLVAAEFDDYRIGIDASITFCLKELRAVLLFTEAINHALSLKFETAGRPVVISIDDCPDYQADFVLATLLDAQEPTPSQVLTTSTPRHMEAESSRPRHTATEPSFVEEEEEEGPQAPKRAATRGVGGRDGDATSKVNITFPSDLMSRVNIPEPPSKINIPAPQGPSSKINIPAPPGPPCKTNIPAPPGPLSKTNISAPPGPPSKINIPAPPDPLLLDDYDMLEADGGGCDTAGSSRVATGEEPPRASQDEGDLTDALFEMENRTDACEAGMFWGIPPREEGAQPQRVVGGSRGGAPELLGCRKGYRNMEEERADTNREPQVAMDNAVRDQDTSVADDSLLSQSGIIPGTPPAKKYKSLMFGMDMFLPNHNISEVLAPDSDEDD